MIDTLQLTKEYKCPKCRGRSCYTEEVILPLAKRRFLPWKDHNRYLLVVCGLCGYSEMYSMKVLAEVQEKEKAKVPEAAPIRKELD